MKDRWIYLPSIEYWIVPFCPISTSEAWMMWMTPGGKFSGITMWKSGWENSGVLSFSSRIKNRTVAVPERDGVPLSSAWTVKQTKTTQEGYYNQETIDQWRLQQHLQFQWFKDFVLNMQLQFFKNIANILKQRGKKAWQGYYG